MHTVRSRRAAAAPPSGRPASLVELLEQMRRDAVTTLDGVAHDAALAEQEARQTQQPAELAALQFEWAAQQWSRGLLSASGALRAWLELQAMAWEQCEASVRAGLAPWSRPGGTAVSIPDDAVAWPVSLADGARRSSEVAHAVVQAWITALDHDLQHRE